MTGKKGCYEVMYYIWVLGLPSVKRRKFPLIKRYLSASLAFKLIPILIYQSWKIVFSIQNSLILYTKKLSGEWYITYLTVFTSIGKKVVYLHKQKCELPTFNLNTFKLKNNTLGLIPAKDILHFPCAGWDTQYHLACVYRRKTPMCDNQETISHLPVKLVLDVLWCWWCTSLTSCPDYEGVWILLSAVMAVSVLGSTSSVFFEQTAAHWL